MVSPDSLGTACPLSGRNSTYRLVQISETSSHVRHVAYAKDDVVGAYLPCDITDAFVPCGLCRRN
jgi:hypothetical protein